MEFKFSKLLTTVAAVVVDGTDIDLLLINVSDGVGTSSVALKDVIDSVEVRLPVDIAVTVVTDGTKFSSLLDTTDDGSLLDNILMEVMYIDEGKLLLDTVLLNPIDGPESFSLFDMMLVGLLECIDDAEIIVLLDATLLIIVVDVAEAIDGADDVEISTLLDTTLVDTGNNEGVIISVMIDTAMVDTIDGVAVELLDNELICSLLDITLVDISDNADVSSLFDSELVLFTDSMGVTSLLEIILTKVADNVVLLEAKLLNINVTAEVCSLVIMTTIVEFVTVLVTVTNGAVVEILDNGFVCSVLDITLVDIIDDVDVSSLLDSKLLLCTDGMEVPSLLETTLKEVANDALLETDIDNEDICSLVILTGIVEFTLLFVAVLVEVTICTEVSSLFDAAVVEVTNSVDIVLLFNTVLVAVIKCEVADCSSFDVILMCLMNDVDIIVLSDTEALPVINGKEACSLLDIVLVDATNVELKFSLLLTIIAADTASDADISILLDSPPANAVNVDGVGDSLVIVPLLEIALTEAAFKVEFTINDTEVSSLRAVVITGTIEYSSLFIAVLTEVIFCKDVSLLLDVGVMDTGEVVLLLVNIASVDVIDCIVKDSSLLGTTLILVTDNVDIPVLLDTETSGKLCLLTEITLVEFRSLFVVLLVEVTVSTGVTVISLFDTTMVEVTDVGKIS